MAHLIARVAVERAGYHFDKLYSYLVPSRFSELAVPGARVVVPFGKGNSKSVGIIFSVEDVSDIEKIKPIDSFPDREPVADERTCKTALWLKEHTFCTMFEGIKAQLPAGINLKMIAEYRQGRAPTEEEKESFSAEERTVLFCLANSPKPVPASRIAEILGEDGGGVTEGLCARGLIERTDIASRTIGDVSVKLISLTDDEDALEAYFSSKRSPQQQRVADLLKDVGTASAKEVMYFTGVTAGVLKTLEKNRIIVTFEEETYRRPAGAAARGETPFNELTERQKEAADGLCELCRSGQPAAALLYGVTGSGKTRVYVELIRRALAEGKNSIMMVPEIALTPQTAAMFYSEFGDNVAVIHSGLSMGERTDEWKRIRRGEAKIALGTRSAVFAPFDRVGLIIMDEEQDSAYKSDANPRYHARDVAKYLAVRDGGLLLLGSATPSMESYYAAEKGRYRLFTLPERYGKAVLPKVSVCDVSGVTNGVIGDTLAKEIKENLARGEKTILLHNRRGYNTFVVCENCRTVYTCPNCSVSMTYHSANGRLMCHYCGYTCSPDVKCRECGSGEMRFSGYGTQRVEDELGEKFPGIRVLRMDSDTASCRNGHDRLLGEFESGNYDILLGTQMVAKGLNFPEVTLVGVISADQTLYCNDFRAYERAFSLLTQVAGRSGRGGKKGRAVIQTFTPDNPVFELSAAQDYTGFYREEIVRRRLTTYPPFCDICEVCVSGQQHNRVRDCTSAFFDLIARGCEGEFADMPIKVLNPSPAGIAKKGNRYFYRLIIKCRNDRQFRSFMAGAIKEFELDRANKGITVSADINPSIIL